MLSLASFASAHAGEITISGKQTVESYSDSEIIVEDKAELFMTSKTPLINSTIDLKTEDSWVYFTNIIPSQVINNWLKYITVDGVSAKKNVNVRIEIYLQGAVVIPHPSGFKPLEIFTEPDFGGTSVTYDINYHKSLGAMDKQMRSFKLKKGYMATFATLNSGGGYSRVFVADKEDLEIATLQSELDETVSFIRVMKWRWASKKGVAGGGDARNALQVTWFYDWGAGTGSTDDYEFIPMRHFRYWDGWEKIEAQPHSTAVLGFNEPWNPDDHKDQNPTTMSIDECIQLWPNFMKSGLRIGSPAPTDGNSAKLIEFIKKADALGLRVDFVALHFYRGGQSASQFYNYIKSIHDQTGRPIWVTEWNNGANWTSESWPSTLVAQQTEQLNDIKAFTEMLDNAPFVERYAIYNHVEEKRYLYYPDNFALTPAGEWYRNHPGGISYDANYQVVPKWTYEIPQINTAAMNTDRTIFSISVATNPNGALTTGLLLEKKIGDAPYIQVDSLDYSTTSIKIPVSGNETGKISFRLRYSCKGGKYTDYSKEVGYSVMDSKTTALGRYDISSTSDWMSVFYQREEAPVAIAGPVTDAYNSALLLTHRLRLLGATKFDYRILPWTYQTATFRNLEQTSFLTQSAGSFDWGGLKGYCQVISATAEWTTVEFETPFATTPVVFTTQVSNSNTFPVAARIKNVTSTGFEIILTKEGTRTNTIVSEKIAYLAVTPGEGKINGCPVIVGTNSSLGTTRISATNIEWGKEIADPAFFATMQTANDTYGAEVRLRTLTTGKAQIYKQAENSEGNAWKTTKEEVGWMVAEQGKGDNSTIFHPTNNNEKWTLYPNPATDIIFFENANRQTVQVVIYDMPGRVIQQFQTNHDAIDIQDLSKGYYFVKINDRICKVLKQ